MLQEVDQQAIEEALGIELGKDDEDEDEEQEGTHQTVYLCSVALSISNLPAGQTCCGKCACLVADEQSEEEEPATTSADDEASKKATTEQQKQLSKKVRFMFVMSLCTRNMQLCAHLM